MGTQLILGIIGLSSGLVVAGGVIALLVGLNIITRYGGITRTARYVRIYETCVLLGSLWGNIYFIYGLSWHLGGIGLGIMGLFFGIYVGSWILALAEIVNIFPIFSRRLGLTKGISILIIAMAVGKTLGSIYHFLIG